MAHCPHHHLGGGVGDEVYVRSWRGPTGTWYGRALHTRRGHVRAPGVEADIAFDPSGASDQGAVDQAYRAKYARYAGSYLDPMRRPAAAVATLRLDPC